MIEIKLRHFDGKYMQYSREFDTLYDYLHHFKEFEKEELLYTGLKDKNGVEIYEGDIIDYTILHTGATLGISGVEQTGIGAVEYHISYFRILNPFTLSNPLRDDSCFKCEVIGNIYENKNLLNA